MPEPLHMPEPLKPLQFLGEEVFCGKHNAQCKKTYLGNLLELDCRRLDYNRSSLGYMSSSSSMERGREVPCCCHRCFFHQHECRPIDSFFHGKNNLAFLFDVTILLA